MNGLEDACVVAEVVVGVALNKGLLPPSDVVGACVADGAAGAAALAVFGVPNNDPPVPDKGF